MRASPGQLIISPGANGVIDSFAEGDDRLVHKGIACTSDADCRPPGDAPLAACDGREALVRVKQRRMGDFNRVWVVLASGRVPAGADFGRIVLRPGDNITMGFIQDIDGDGIFAREEFIYRSSDTARDSDGDTLDDPIEIGVGWDVGVVGDEIRHVFPDPSVPDSDGDGLTDRQERDYTDTVCTPDCSLDPRRADTDGDGVSDADETSGYLVRVSIKDGGNGVANTQALGDDVQKVFIGNPVGPSGVVILPGRNGTIDSEPGVDDVLFAGVTARTNPLNPDHDGDTRPDGLERDQGSDPTDSNDSDDFLDSDRDGLSDAEEELTGWTVVWHDAGGSHTLDVKSNKFVADTDNDGLPDFLERAIATNPTRDDTDGDGINDFDEFDDFASYINLHEQFPGFVLDGRSSLLIGSSPLNADTDGDGLTDYQEAFNSWRVLIDGEVRPVFSSPLFADTDLDGATDWDERLGADCVDPDDDINSTDSTDPTLPDTDGDGTLDGSERCCASSTSNCADRVADPLVPDVGVTLRVMQIELDGPRADPSAWVFTLLVRRPQLSPGVVMGNIHCNDPRCVPDGCPDCILLNHTMFGPSNECGLPLNLSIFEEMGHLYHLGLPLSDTLAFRLDAHRRDTPNPPCASSFKCGVEASVALDGATLANLPGGWNPLILNATSEMQDHTNSAYCDVTLVVEIYVD